MIFAVAFVYLLAFGAWFMWRAFLGGLGRYFPPGADRPGYLKRAFLIPAGVVMAWGLYATAANAGYALAYAVIAVAAWTLPHAPGIALGRLPINIDRDKWSGWIAYPLAHLVGRFDAAPGSPAARRWAFAYLAVNYSLRTFFVWAASCVPAWIVGRKVLATSIFAPQLPFWLVPATGIAAAVAYGIGWAAWDRGVGIKGDNPSDQGGMHLGEALNGGLWGVLTLAACLSMR